MKFHNFKELVKKIYHPIQDKINTLPFNTTLTDDLHPNNKYIYTKEWGVLKVRKNGAVRLCINGDIIRVTLRGSYFDKRFIK